jgi:hypothetical protein
LSGSCLQSGGSWILERAPAASRSAAGKGEAYMPRMMVTAYAADHRVTSGKPKGAGWDHDFLLHMLALVR